MRLERNISSEWMRNERTPVDNYDNSLQLQFMFVSACFQAFMIPKDYCANVYFTATDVKYLDGIFCMVATHFEPCSLLPKVQNLKLAPITSEKSRKGIRRTYFDGERAELCYRK